MCGLGDSGIINTVIRKPEERISAIISDEAGIYINPQVMRLIVKYRWDELAKAAHEIHGSAS